MAEADKSSRWDRLCPVAEGKSYRAFFLSEWRAGRSHSEIARRTAEEGITKDIVKNVLHRTPEYMALRSAPSQDNPSALRGEREDLTTILSDKKNGQVDWRELCAAADDFSRTIRKTSSSQNEVTIAFPEAKRPIAVTVLGDWHWGSYGTDHSLLVKLTDDILSIPDLYVIVVGDMEQMSIKMRGVREMMDNVLPPEVQQRFTESWLQEIKHRILFACWDNHSVMRNEDQAGSSAYKEIMSRHVAYSNGIGHADVVVGEERYRIAVSHFFRGKSKNNPCYGQMMYMREQAIDREIAVAGDSHVPGVMQYVEGGVVRLGINCGTAQLNSGYAQRFCSLKTWPVFPCFTLAPDEHRFSSFWSVRDYLETRL